MCKSEVPLPLPLPLTATKSHSAVASSSSCRCRCRLVQLETRFMESLYLSVAASLQQLITPNATFCLQFHQHRLGSSRHRHICTVLDALNNFIGGPLQVTIWPRLYRVTWTTNLLTNSPMVFIWSRTIFSGISQSAIISRYPPTPT